MSLLKSGLQIINSDASKLTKSLEKAVGVVRTLHVRIISLTSKVEELQTVNSDNKELLKVQGDNAVKATAVISKLSVSNRKQAEDLFKKNISIKSLLAENAELKLQAASGTLETVATVREITNLAPLKRGNIYRDDVLNAYAKRNNQPVTVVTVGRIKTRAFTASTWLGALNVNINNILK